MGAPKLTPQQQPHHHDDDHDEAPPKKVEEGEGPWLVSYADLMTLLMGFFALISSFSSPSQQKFEQVKESASEAFGGEYEHPYEGLGKALAEFVEKHNLKDQVQIKVGYDGVEMTFTGTLFFDSGDYIVKPAAVDLMSKLAEEIKNLPKNYNALIEGHTDSLPINHPIISSNWELSGIRAARIAQLFEKKGFAKDSLTIIGWGDTKLLFPDKNPQGQGIPDLMTKNRRVIIKVYDRKLTRDPIEK